MKTETVPATNTALEAGRENLLARVGEILACPECKTPLDSRATRGELVCRRCGAQAMQTEQQFLFEAYDEQEIQDDWLNQMKESAKRRLGKFYQTAIKAFSPVYSLDYLNDFVDGFNTERELVVDLGSGTRAYRQNVVCLDGANYDNVHVVGTVDKLPFEDASLDGIISIAVLEHVPHPEECVQEMWRVLKPGGRLLCCIPFIQGFHASPHDYQRYTQRGLRVLFGDFEVSQVRVGGGPTSGMLWVLQEWLALVLSLGSRRLYRWIMPLTWILSPLKFLDILLSRHPEAQAIASNNVIVAIKPKSAKPAEA